MYISVFELMILVGIMGLVGALIAYVQNKCYKKYWYKDVDDGCFRSHFTWKKFLRDFFAGDLL
jgi:uncharacterized membrane protein